MSKKIKTLDAYTRASNAIIDFRKKHKKIFSELESLQIKAQEAEEALKEDVREKIKANVQNDFVRVTYSPAFSKGYNAIKILKAIAPKTKKQLCEMGAIKESVVIDGKKFEEAVEMGIVKVTVKQDAFEEKELTPRVSIKALK